jgi:hypothetical protein
LSYVTCSEVLSLGDSGFFPKGSCLICKRIDGALPHFSESWTKGRTVFVLV